VRDGEVDETTGDITNLWYDIVFGVDESDIGGDGVALVPLGDLSTISDINNRLSWLDEDVYSVL